MRKPQVVRDLEAARDVLARCGLAKRSMRDAAGRVCAHGALYVAIGGDAFTLPFGGLARHEEAVSFVAMAPDVEASSFLGGTNIADWNNADERTQDEVLAAFDAAASMALSEAVRK